jgi:hypothetical protein
MVPLKPVVKKIKGRVYVYLQGRENGKVVTKYLGPLDRIVNEWLTCKQLLSEEDLNRGWWTGRDLNPGPLGCEPSALPG